MQIRWDGGLVRLWPGVRCASKPTDWIRRNRVTGPGTDLQELVYRMRLINPATTVKGIAPPTYITSNSGHRPF